MANTKVTSNVLADDAVNISNINTVDGNGGASSPSADGQALVAKLTVGTSDYYLDWADNTVAGISSSADATAITIDSSENVIFSQRVGIDTTSPDAELHIEPVSSNASILLSNDGRTQYYRIQNNESADALTFNLSDASEKLRIQSGGGISFNGDTATANALDDYEEGTFTPTVNSGSATTQWAKYTKIGDLVYIVCEITLGGTRTANQFLVGGLPFTNGPNWTPANFYVSSYTNEGTEQISGAFKASTNDFTTVDFGSNALGTHFGNGYFAFSGVYKIQ